MAKQFSVGSVLLVGIVAAQGAGCGEEPALSLAALQQRAGELNGQRVRVRGFAQLLENSTLMSCGTQACCNSGWGDLYLTATRTPGGDTSSFYNDALQVDATVGQEPLCRGSECQQTCTPFNPAAAPAFEMVGVFSVASAQTFARYSLASLDLSASSQLTGEGDLAALRKAPIPTGSFTVTFVR